MNNKVYNELIEAQKLKNSMRSWKNYSYNEYIANDYQLLKKFISESTLGTYTLIWRKVAREYICYLNKNNLKYIYPTLDGLPTNYFYHYTGLVDNLRNALEVYKAEKKSNLRAHFMTDSYTSSIYDVDLLLSMLTLDGFTYKFESKEHNNNFIRLRISIEQLEEHIKKANELNIWMNNNKEDEEKREVLLRNLQN